jgi:hypothetical protein
MNPHLALRLAKHLETQLPRRPPPRATGPGSRSALTRVLGRALAVAFLVAVALAFLQRIA